MGGDTPEARERAAKVVPREYLKLDDGKLTAAATKHKGQLKVAGIEFFSADTTRRK